MERKIEDLSRSNSPRVNNFDVAFGAVGAGLAFLALFSGCYAIFSSLKSNRDNPKAYSENVREFIQNAPSSIHVFNEHTPLTLYLQDHDKDGRIDTLDFATRTYFHRVGWTSDVERGSLELSADTIKRFGQLDKLSKELAYELFITQQKSLGEKR